MPSFGAASMKQLQTCDPRLQQLFLDVVQEFDCQIIEGKRSEAQQRINVAKGVSKTMQSKHVYPLDSLSLAVDVAPYPVKWTDTERFYAFGGYVLGIAKKLGIKIRWGGDWDSDREFSDQTFHDLPHYELID